MLLGSRCTVCSMLHPDPTTTTFATPPPPGAARSSSNGRLPDVEEKEEEEEEEEEAAVEAPHPMLGVWVGVDGECWLRVHSRFYRWGFYYNEVYIYGKRLDTC